MALPEESIGTLSSLYESFYNAADPRVNGMLLMDSPFPVTIICAVYIYFVTVAGPKFMKNRKPFDLRWVLVVYNAAQAIFSAWLFYGSIIYFSNHIGFSCSKADPKKTDDTTMWSVRMCHYYFLSKISELADTVFFVLKKKNNHISLLHVFHHAAMAFSVWFGVKFSPGGNLTFFGLPNLFVHIWMYLYYMMAAMGPQYQKYIWWKRHITQMQLGQFAIIMGYMLHMSNACNLSKHFVYWILALDIAFVFLFIDFYRKTYLRKTKKVEERENEALQKSDVQKVKFN